GGVLGRWCLGTVLHLSRSGGNLDGSTPHAGDGSQQTVAGIRRATRVSREGTPRVAPLPYLLERSRCPARLRHRLTASSLASRWLQRARGRSGKERLKLRLPLLNVG